MRTLLPAPEPVVPSDQRAQGRVPLRFEDVSQDGRLVLEALPTALGEVWRGLAERRPRALGRASGIVPILSRVIVEGGEGPIAVAGPAEVEGVYQLAHTLGRDGQVDRIVLGMWAQVTSVVGATHGPEASGTRAAPSSPGRRGGRRRGVRDAHLAARPRGRRAVALRGVTPPRRHRERLRALKACRSGACLFYLAP